jgi:RHS repeat-associated protein
MARATGEATTYAYDTVNRKTSMTDPNTNVTSYGYDSANRQTTTTDPLGHTSTSTYDADNRLISVTDALGHTTTYGYDNNGNRTIVTDALLRTTTYAFDQQNRLITVTDPLLGVTTYAYDQASRRISITDAVGNITTNAYDNANRLITVTDPNSHLTTYAYDNANQLTSVTDRNGRQTTYSYDQVGNKTGETWVGGSYIATYGYDAANRLTVEQDTFSKYTLGYDNANRLTSVDNLGTPNMPRVLLTYGYDNFSNRTSIQDNFSGTENLTYDSDNNLTNLSITKSPPWSYGNTVALAYDSANRLTSINRQWGNKFIGNTNVNTTYGYDNTDRLTGITHLIVGGSTLMTLTYGYDNANQLTSYAGPDGSITYGYDVDGQLTGATGAHNETYSYDKEGNRTLTGYVTSIGNRLTSDGTYTYAYDQDGNMIGRTKTSNGEITTFTWDFRNRLTEVLIKTSGGTTLQDDKFTYDIENRRIGKNTLSGGQSWTAYVDTNPFMDFNSAGSLLYRYLYGNAIDFLLGRIDASGNAMWYLTDKLGSVRENTDGSGNVLDSITYDTYGNIISETHSSSGDRFKYTSREWDSEIGQYFYRARYFAPSIGRFESEDPLGFSAGDTDLYRYVRNSPISANDATGLLAIKDKIILLKTVRKELKWNLGVPSRPDYEGFVLAELFAYSDKGFHLYVTYDTWNSDALGPGGKPTSSFPGTCDRRAESHFPSIYITKTQRWDWDVPATITLLKGWREYTSGAWYMVAHTDKNGTVHYCSRVTWVFEGFIAPDQGHFDGTVKLRIGGSSGETLGVFSSIDFKPAGSMPAREADAQLELSGPWPWSNDSRL